MEVGDLLLVACDGDSLAGDIALRADTSVYVPTRVGLASIPSAGAASGVEAQIFYGTVLNVPDGGALSMTASTRHTPSFLDCSVNVYRGGSLPVALVDSISQGGGNGAAVDSVSCGAVATQAGGVALYVAVIYTCAGDPLDTRWTQRSGIDGNPDGDVVPTDGNPVSTTLAECNASTGYWTCLTASFSP